MLYLIQEGQAYNDGNYGHLQAFSSQLSPFSERNQDLMNTVVVS